LLQLSCALTGHISVLLCIVEGQWGYHNMNKHGLADTLFEILEGWGT